MMGNSTHPPLTTVFTPAPACATPLLQHCFGSVCQAGVFSATQIFGNEATMKNVNLCHSSCYPSPDLTYSPGLYCPAGMTTASDGPSNAYCCPSGMSIQEYSYATVCEGVLTGGPLFVNSNGCSTTSLGSARYPVSVSATPVLLIRNQTVSSLSRPPSPSPSPTSPSGQGSGDSGLPAKVKVIIGVTVPLGALLLLSFAFAIIKYYRRRTERGRTVETVENGGGDTDHAHNKPELVGTVIGGPLPRTELDALAVRAELEGPHMENGAGIYVQKPELGGSDISHQQSGAVGVHVQRKWELGGRSTC
ncbi:hypothetical protein F5Y17DRAFT_389943 [Xylariaceae sp. FL0594]|nr:hypothetical protein F5Y17DRAFT_389943 [Xylariaceae sp. FL0594]